MTSNCPPFNSRVEALVPNERGEKQVALHASNAQSSLFAIKFAEEVEPHAALYGVTEGWKVADAIAEYALPIFSP